MLPVVRVLPLFSFTRDSQHQCHLAVARRSVSLANEER